jgi:hypothetical protein
MPSRSGFEERTSLKYRLNAALFTIIGRYSVGKPSSVLGEEFVPG